MSLKNKCIVLFLLISVYALGQNPSLLFETQKQLYQSYYGITSNLKTGEQLDLSSIAQQIKSWEEIKADFYRFYDKDSLNKYIKLNYDNLVFENSVSMQLGQNLFDAKKYNDAKDKFLSVIKQKEGYSSHAHELSLCYEYLYLISLYQGQHQDALYYQKCSIYWKERDIEELALLTYKEANPSIIECVREISSDVVVKYENALFERNIPELEETIDYWKGILKRLTEVLGTMNVINILGSDDENVPSITRCVPVYSFFLSEFMPIEKEILLGNISKAEQLESEFKQKYKDFFLSNPIYLAGIPFELGLFYQYNGYYIQAKDRFEESYLFKTNMPPSVFETFLIKYGTTLQKLGEPFQNILSYVTVNNYVNPQNFIESKKFLADDLCRTKRKYELAKSQIDSAYLIYNKHSEIQGNHQYDLFEKMGHIYSLCGKFKEGLSYLKKAIDMYNEDVKEFPVEFEYPYGLFYDYAHIYFLQGDYKKCETELLKLEKVAKERGDTCAFIFSSLLKIKIQQKKYQEIPHYLYKIWEDEQKNTLKNFNVMSSKERSIYWIRNLQSSSLVHEGEVVLANQDATGIGYDIALFYKGLLVNFEKYVTQNVKSSDDESLKVAYQTLLELQIGHGQYWEKEAKIQADFNKYWNHALQTDTTGLFKDESYSDTCWQSIIFDEKAIEKQAKRFARLYNSKFDNSSYIKTWKEVQSKLGMNDCAIEFVEYGKLNVQEETIDGIDYVAFILKKDYEKPVLVRLCSDEELRKGVELKERLYFPENAKNYYNLIWGKLEGYLQDVKNIYMSPTGIMYQMNFEVLPNNKNIPMNQIYNIERLSSTANICSSKENARYTSAVLYGGLQYDMDTMKMLSVKKNYNVVPYYASRGFISDSTVRAGWKYLSATQSEIDTIASLLKKESIRTEIYNDVKGTEESFKFLSGKNISILHLATHGFFLKDEEFKKIKYSDFVEYEYKDTPHKMMSRSGLILSGGQRVWLGENIPDNVEDGILLSEEISLMDLSGTDLVVLSACETGLGDVTSDGIFGLQRAFKQAGVNTLIMSLWKVDDFATKLMMTEFYTHLADGKSKREAFNLAQAKVRATYEDPYYWAGFIMLD